jgi:hypothetical protein
MVASEIDRERRLSGFVELYLYVGTDIPAIDCEPASLEPWVFALEKVRKIKPACEMRVELCTSPIVALLAGERNERSPKRPRDAVFQCKTKRFLQSSSVKEHSAHGAHKQARVFWRECGKVRRASLEDSLSLFLTGHETPFFASSFGGAFTAGIRRTAK